MRYLEYQPSSTRLETRDTQSATAQQQTCMLRLHVFNVHATLLELGAVAQLGARLNGIQKVKGSNPFSSTKTKT